MTLSDTVVVPNVPKAKARWINYRSFRNFDHDMFLLDLENSDLENITKHPCLMPQPSCLIL